MKMHIKKLFHLPALIVGMSLILTGHVSGQIFTTLHSFALPYAGATNDDGDNSAAGLILSGNTLYGTAEFFGNSGSFASGTVFKLNTNGTGYTNLYNFTGGSDGAEPRAGLILSGNTLYGTAAGGGSSGNGTVFAVNTDGSGFTNLYSFTARSGSPFTNSDGAVPSAGMILSGNTLYGTAAGGGSWGNGAVFAVNTDGSGFTNLYSFTATPAYPNSTNSDGANPHAGLILSGNTLYGTATSGGSSGYGTVFALNTDGTNFTTLHSFTNGSDGAHPISGLTLSGNTLYGTAHIGGNSNAGTVFALNTDGTGFTNLYSFTGGSDGSNLDAGLILSGNILYGTAYGGGSWGNGTVFALNTDGSGFTNLYSFTAFSGMGLQNSDGANPEAGLILSGNTLYGTTYEAGGGYHGTVFSLALPLPQLAISLSGTNVILTWPTNAPGFDYSRFTLQSTTNLFSTAIWSTVSGQYAVTNPISSTQEFYRLIQSMALIPAGSFTMGDTLDGESDAIPTNAYVSAFYMDVNLVSYNQWQSVYNYATNHGYGFIHAGAGKAANHPVQTVDWYDTVKWCNARSQQAGLTPVYYIDAGFMHVYTNGETDAVYPNWTANGYRLPTEAEWEKAARGGLSGQRFPWGDTISESQANYQGGSGGYDLGGLNNFDTGATPFTSPVGYFAANGYGLYDMAGNVMEWCWDWYGTPYAGGSDPRGPASGSYNRVERGGYWGNYAYYTRCANRSYTACPCLANYAIGFRCVRGH
jgi:uncharacterized repeat protein (TIGR03803 family)